jgi:hypothetical protein
MIVEEEKDNTSQVVKPTGFFGKILARGMAWGHKDFYKHTAKALNLQNDDNYLEIGCTNSWIRLF